MVQFFTHMVVSHAAERPSGQNSIRGLVIGQAQEIDIDISPIPLLIFMGVKKSEI